MIQIEHVSKSFGSQLLFESINFKLNPKERIGVVGRNGHGKTTLFRMLTGEAQPDAGIISTPRNYRIGYVRQQIAFTEKTILAEAMRGLLKGEEDHHWKAEKILAGLGFSSHDMQRSPDEFSGGFQVRLNLAKVLLSDPDLLLLDEPTNYLDIASIRWIERFLQSWPREIMLITHDRHFMDQIVTHILGIHYRKVRKMPGNTETYYNRIAQEEEIHEKTRLNDERRQKEIQQFITRFRAKARLANLVQSRVKTLQKMEKKEKLQKIKTLDFSFRSEPFQGKTVTSIQDLSFSYDRNTPLIDRLNAVILPGDRICVIGKNGKGKTTLLKLMADLLTPQHGSVQHHPAVKTGIFEQSHIRHLIETRTVEEEILYAHADMDRQQARNICGAMLFQGDHALKKIRVLSGGEKSRVMLGKILATPANLLILDEPTNHLDMDACDALLAAIDNFEGAVVMVTHNEMFLHAVANRLIVFQKNGVRLFDGSYQNFLEKVGWEDEAPRPGKQLPECDRIHIAKPTKKQLRQQRSEIIAARSKSLRDIDRQVEGVETRIEHLEEQLKQLNDAMLEASQRQDGPEIAKISKSLHECRSDIDTLFEKLESLTDKQDSRKAAFEAQLEKLDNG